MELVVDTNALSAWLDGDPAIERPLSFASGLLLSPVALGEYRFGLQASRECTTYESKLQELEQRFKVLAVDRATATFYASIRRYLKTNGTPTTHILIMSILIFASVGRLCEPESAVPDEIGRLGDQLTPEHPVAGRR